MSPPPGPKEGSLPHGGTARSAEGAPASGPVPVDGGAVGAPADDLAALTAELRALEDRLLDPAVRADPAQVRALLAPEFVEFGASGRVFDRDAIVAVLAAGGPQAAQQTRRFRVQPLAPGAALTTWRIRRDDGSQTLRSSVWQRRDGRWQLLFHQGTLAAVDDEGTS